MIRKWVSRGRRSERLLDPSIAGPLFPRRLRHGHNSASGNGTRMVTFSAAAGRNSAVLVHVHRCGPLQPNWFICMLLCRDEGKKLESTHRTKEERRSSRSLEERPERRFTICASATRKYAFNSFVRGCAPREVVIEPLLPSARASPAAGVRTRPLVTQERKTYSSLTTHGAAARARPPIRGWTTGPARRFAVGTVRRALSGCRPRSRAAVLGIEFRSDAATPGTFMRCAAGSGLAPASHCKIIVLRPQQIPRDSGCRAVPYRHEANDMCLGDGSTTR